MNKQQTLGALRTKVIGAIIAITAIAVFCGLFLTDRPTNFRFTATTSIMAAAFSLLTVPLFLNGLKSFKSGLRQSYILLCIGIGLFGLAQIQLPAIKLTGAQIWLSSGAAGVVYFVSVMPMLLGMRKFARLLQLKSVWMSIIMCLTAAIVVSLALVPLPHVQITTSELTFHIFIGIVVWAVFVALFCGILAFKIRDIIATTYKKSLVWLGAAFFNLVICGIHFIIVRYIFKEGDWYLDYSIAVLPFIVAGLLFIKAGFEFNTINYVLSEGDADLPQVTEGKHPEPSAMDIISHVASLASNPSDIDAILDDMRIVTSHIENGQAPDAEDNDKLGEVYQRLVVYLTRQDPLRQYTEESIRTNLTTTFGDHVAFLEKQHS